MGLLDGIRNLGSKLNEARYSHKTVMVPIGVDPDTGEDIEIPEDELLSKGMYDPQSKRIVMPESQRTGPSKFGNFLSKGLPRILQAGIAAGAAPADGSTGIVSVLRGMQVGGQELDRRDMMAYNLARQKMQDEAIQEDRAARAAENRMQTEMYRRKMEEGPVPKEEPIPTSYVQLLVQRLRNEQDPAKRAEIEKELRAASQGGQRADPAAEWSELKRRASELFKPDSPEWKSFVASGGKMPNTRPPAASSGAVQWGNGKGGQQQGMRIVTDPDTGKPIAVPIEGLTRDKPGRARAGGGAPRRDPNIGTRREFMSVDDKKASELAKAEKEAEEEAANLMASAKMSPEKKGPLLDSDLKLVWAKLEKRKQQIYADFNRRVAQLSGGGGGNPMAPPRQVQGTLPGGAPTPFAAPGLPLWKQHPAAQPFIRR